MCVCVYVCVCVWGGGGVIALALVPDCLCDIRGVLSVSSSGNPS